MPQSSRQRRVRLLIFAVSVSALVLALWAINRKPSPQPVEIRADYPGLTVIRVGAPVVEGRGRYVVGLRAMEAVSVVAQRTSPETHEALSNPDGPASAGSATEPPRPRWEPEPGDELELFVLDADRDSPVKWFEVAMKHEFTGRAVRLEFHLRYDTGAFSGHILDWIDSDMPRAYEGVFTSCNEGGMWDGTEIELAQLKLEGATCMLFLRHGATAPTRSDSNP